MLSFSPAVNNILCFSFTLIKKLESNWCEKNKNQCLKSSDYEQSNFSH